MPQTDGYDLTLAMRILWHPGTKSSTNPHLSGREHEGCLKVAQLYREARPRS